MRVAVLGAGVAGLTAAYELGERGHRCDVYERWPGLGGQAATLDIGEAHPLERYYHHLFTTDRDIVDLYARLGLAEEIEWRPSTVGMFTGGTTYPFTTPLDLLRFSPLSRRARLRLGLATLALERRRSASEDFAGQTAREWIERWMGREVYATVWGPLLRAKFGEHADAVSMVWLHSKLTLRRPLERRGVREERLGYPRGSWQRLFGALCERIERHGGRILVDRPAREIGFVDGRFVVVPGAPGSFRSGHDPRGFPPGGDATSYDAVLATVPSDVFLRLLDQALEERLGAEYVRRVGAVTYRAALCVLLELDRPLLPYYWTNVLDADVRFAGLIEHTNFVEPARYGGRRFVYVANYVARDDPLLSLGVDELLAAYAPGLGRVRPDFSLGWVRQAWVFHEPAAQPVVTVDYERMMPPLETPVPGLLLANTTQIYPQDRGTNYSVRLGRRAAAVLADGFAVGRRGPVRRAP